MGKFSKNEIIAHNKGYFIDKSGIVWYKNNIVNGFIRGGYKIFSFKENNLTKACFFHRLQAYQKYGDKIYTPKIECRHKNNIKIDNFIDNIEIGTHSQNIMDRPKEMRILIAKIASSKLIKYDKNRVKLFHISNGKSYNKTMKEFNISSKGTLCYLLNN